MYKLVLIKNGGDYDPHCGELINYSPIIIENDTLCIDNAVKLSCVRWQVNIDTSVITLNNKKYVIYKNGEYGYTHNGVETYYSDFMSGFFEEKIKDLCFEHCILHS